MQQSSHPFGSLIIFKSVDVRLASTLVLSMLPTVFLTNSTPFSLSLSLLEEVHVVGWNLLFLQAGHCQVVLELLGILFSVFVYFCFDFYPSMAHVAGGISKMFTLLHKNLPELQPN